MYRFVVRFVAVVGISAMAALAPFAAGADGRVLLGPGYKGPKCPISVGQFSVRLKGAPKNIGGGMREMMVTGLFESNRFIVLDRSDSAGISAERLLSKSFLKDPNSILNPKKKPMAARMVIYGAITDIEQSEGRGLRIKIPGVPINIGGGYQKSTVSLEIRVARADTGQLMFTKMVTGTATSGKGLISGGLGIPGLNTTLQTYQNTPLGLAIRDCIYRAIIMLAREVPPERCAVRRRRGR